MRRSVTSERVVAMLVGKKDNQIWFARKLGRLRIALRFQRKADGTERSGTNK